MRWPVLMVLINSMGFSQSLLEHAGAAAGGSVGGVAGKKVSDGMTAIFGKVDQTAKKAAKGATAKSAASNEPAFEVGPGVPKQRASVPPPPPPVRKAAVTKTAPMPMPTQRIVLPLEKAEVEPALTVSLSELRGVTSGMSRSEVLKLGTPSARITMYDDGHLVEIYRYLDREANLGTLRLTDGAVSSVQVH